MLKMLTPNCKECLTKEFHKIKNYYISTKDLTIYIQIPNILFFVVEYWFQNSRINNMKIINNKIGINSLMNFLL